MSFLQPFLLFALPLALLPVIIHLIHQQRRRTVPWAAMMFLRRAQSMNRGLSKLRRWLILAFRVLALLALLLMVARPLAGGLLGLTGGAPDTVIVLLDRSATMQQTYLATGLSKREAGLNRMVDGMNEAYRGRSRVVLIDSATMEINELGSADALLDHPASWATDTTADIPGLLQGALDYIIDNQTGRTDVWLLSDLQASTWEAGASRWDSLRQSFQELPGVRFHLLCYPEPAVDNLALSVDRVTRREGREQAELVLDLDVVRTDLDASVSDPDGLAADSGGRGEGAREIPLRFVINGVTTVVPVELRDGQASLRGHVIPIDRAIDRGWGRVELPGDSQPSDNVWHFVFDRPAVMSSAIVSANVDAMQPVRAALRSPADSSREYQAAVYAPERTAEIDWENTALIVWHAPLPDEDDLVQRQLQNHLAAGRSILFFPPDDAAVDAADFMGVSWGDWNQVSGDPMQVVGWRNDTGLLANTRDGTALPVGELQLLAWRQMNVEGATATPLARLDNQQPLLLRVTAEDAEPGAQGAAYFVATLPGTRASSMARDGVVLFAMLHRALAAGADTLGLAQQRFASSGIFPDEEELREWRPVADAAQGDEPAATPSELLTLRAGILTAGERLLALNRPPSEDQPRRLALTTVDERFEGLDHRVIIDALEEETNLASEIWRTFLLLMAAALILEALLSMPRRSQGARNPSAQPTQTAQPVGSAPAPGTSPSPGASGSP